LYPFKHRSLKWTSIPFFATLSITAWNASVYLGGNDNHEIYKKVLIGLCHYLGKVTVRKDVQKLNIVSNTSLPNQINHLPLQTKHALSTPLKTHAMNVGRGHCLRCLKVDNIKRKTQHYCVHCSNENNITWYCKECFEWVHMNPKYIRKLLYLTTKPFSAQLPLYSTNE